MHRLFNKWRTDPEAEDPHIRCSASELLSLYGLLRNFMQTEIGDRADVRPELDSFYACCRVIDCFGQATSRGINMRQAGVELGFCLQAHMRLHKSAYGVSEPSTPQTRFGSCRKSCQRSVQEGLGEGQEQRYKQGLGEGQSKRYRHSRVDSQSISVPHRAGQQGIQVRNWHQVSKRCQNGSREVAYN